MSTLECPAGSVLAREGDVGREFFLVSEGAVEVRHGDTPVADVKAGDFFGELALMGDGRRTATVIATDDLVVEVMNRREFASMRDLWPELSNLIGRRAVQRLARDF